MMIESRPAPRGAFEYIFYADCMGHRTDEPFVAAMDKLKSQALEITILGSYPLVESD
jgi:prephenate dehydratase